MSTNAMQTQTKSMIDGLKTVCTNFGLGNASSEYKIITEVFLYKYLNDKFLFEVKEQLPEFKGQGIGEVESYLKQLSDKDYERVVFTLDASTAVLKKEHLISYLYDNQNKADFHQLFDNTLISIANENIEIFSVRTGGETKIRLFDSLSQFVLEAEKRDGFCRAIVERLAAFSFEQAFNQKYDFFATIFEYLIKDYNKDFGKYAEYYTPQVIAGIIAKILVPDGDSNVTVYDPAAGSGTLVLALAHEIGEENCTIFTQDISQKSNEFLRLNLILNNLVHSLPNVVNDDTLLHPRHLNSQKNGIQQFDYIVSNPPFNMDFHDNRDTLAGESYKSRFFAGVPSVPNKKLDSMAIYLLFVQHIIKSLGDKGKAAVVVPTGFLTASSGIQKTIKQHLIDHNMLSGVISMPSNIFATTGTNVSILFIDKGKADDTVVLIDASKLGEKVKEDGKNQKTVLKSDEVEQIINAFNRQEKINDFSAVVTNEEIVAKKLSFSAGQHFTTVVEVKHISADEFSAFVSQKLENVNALFSQQSALLNELNDKLASLNYAD
jgi:type I restriction enzyme M protein